MMVMIQRRMVVDMVGGGTGIFGSFGSFGSFGIKIGGGMIVLISLVGCFGSLSLFLETM